ncbi:sensor domain-containing protein [Desulfuribacillus alkaliarsenatis]|nr:EAL domain-containing protein [Desulfuribacillus alkaliarsenatis]
MSAQYWESIIDALFHNSPDAIVYFDKEERIRNVNQKFSEIFGYTLEQVHGKNVNEVVDPENRMHNYASAEILQGKNIIRETVRYTKDGNEVPVIIRGVPLMLDGEVVGGYGTYINMTDLSLAKEQVSIYSHALEYSPNSIIMTDVQGTITYVNNRFTKVTGYSSEEVIGSNPRILSSGNTAEEVYADLWNTIKIGGIWRGELQNRKKNGLLFWESVSISSIKNVDNEIIRFVAVKEDISERKELERSNYYLAYHDPLTGLPNRVSFINHINRLLDDKGHKDFAVLIIDLDRFKNINDSLGHDFGDLLLQAVTERLQESLDSKSRVFRVGGDEFTVVYEGSQKLTDTAENILTIFKEPFEIIDRRIYMTVSVGVSIYPQDGIEVNMLLKNADVAMYAAKNKGRNQYVFYQTSMNERAEELLLLENELRQALEKEQLVLYYQPQIDIKTKNIIGLEALVRWNHPRLKFVSPADFIPLAEETGLIVQIGEWVLKTACKTMKKLLETNFPATNMAVNISVKQFTHQGFIETVEQALQEANLEPRYLDLEVTESLAMNDVEWVAETLHVLRRIGVTISIDDFGTGYSSLNNFRSLPINKLKIDKSFVNRVTFDQKDDAIVKSVINLAHSLNLTVIAEGVETLDQFELLRNYRCDAFQGYLFSKPVPEGKLNSLLMSLK